MNIFIILVIAISLSMDTFSLSLAYGMLSFYKRDIFILSIIVGLFHFFMPILGLLLGNIITKYINTNLIIFVVFLFIGIEMLISSFKEEKINSSLKLFEMILFGLAVSIDSFSVGIGLNAISNNYILCSTIFCIVSGLFTFLGLTLGNVLNKTIGNISKFIGGFTLIILAFIYLI